MKGVFVLEKRKVMLGRASTSRQEMSKEMQLDAIQAKYGVMDEVYFDTASGDAKLEKREAVIECIANLNKGDTIYIYSWSRLARDVFIHLWIEEEVKKKKAFIVSLEDGSTIEDTAEKKFLRVILAAASQLNKAQIKMAVASSRATMRKNGKYMGGKRQYGYEIIEGDVLPIEEEQKVIKRLVRELKDEGKTMKAITEGLNEDNIPSATGNTWHYMSVRKILKRAS